MDDLARLQLTCYARALNPCAGTVPAPEAVRRLIAHLQAPDTTSEVTASACIQCGAVEHLLVSDAGYLCPACILQAYA